MGHMPSSAGPISLELTRGIVSVRDYGAVGDGSTDDTTAWTNALATGRTVVGYPGDTYIVNGGLAVATAGQTIDMTGCKVRLKTSASSKALLSLNAARARVVGGDWDMNVAGNTGGDAYGYYAVLLNADHTVAEKMYVHDCYGIGIKGVGAYNYREVRECRIENCAGHGVFFDGPTTADSLGTRIAGCTVIVTATSNAVGIYVHSVAPYTYQGKRWSIDRNTVIGPSSASSAVVGITGRGSDGIVVGNHVRNFDIGISIDRSISLRSVVSDNRVETDYTAYGGIEVNGGDSVISGNYVRGHNYGIVGTTVAGGGETIDNRTIIGNRLLDQATYGIYVAPLSGDTARRQNIIGNVITAATGVNGLIRLARDCKHSLIQGNLLRGGGSGVSGGRGVFLDAVNSNIGIHNNRFGALERTVTLYNNTGTAYTDIAFVDNDVTDDIATIDTQWLNLEGTATYGKAVQIMGTFHGFTGHTQRDITDCANSIIVHRNSGSSNPEGSLTANPGSLYGYTSSGETWTKEGGAGNTGWKPVGFVPRSAPTYGANVAVATRAYTGEFVVTPTDANAFQIDNPTTPVTGARITIRIRNTTGGALGAVTFGTAYKLSAWVSPATGNSRAIDFQYDGTNWIEVSRTPADVPN